MKAPSSLIASQQPQISRGIKVWEFYPTNCVYALIVFIGEAEMQDEQRSEIENNSDVLEKMRRFKREKEEFQLQKELFEKEREDFEAEKELFEKEKEFLEKELDKLEAEKFLLQNEKEAFEELLHEQKNNLEG